MRRRRESDRLTDEAELRLILTCAYCGRPIVLYAGPNGVVLPEREDMLQLHAQCLVAARSAERPADQT